MDAICPQYPGVKSCVLDIYVYVSDFFLFFFFLKVWRIRTVFDGPTVAIPLGQRQKSFSAFTSIMQMLWPDPYKLDLGS
jgi:hypothetical protein